MAKRLTNSATLKRMNKFPKDWLINEQLIYQKLGQLEDIMEKYDINSVEELEHIILNDIAGEQSFKEYVEPYKQFINIIREHIISPNYDLSGIYFEKNGDYYEIKLKSGAQCLFREKEFDLIKKVFKNE